MTAIDLLTTGEAEISPCGNYRYELRRIWDTRLPLLAFIMLNPSTADATIDDNTIRWCVSFAKANGFGGIIVKNLFALRSTFPSELYKHADPVGPDNDRWLTAGTPAELTIAAWGNHGSYLGRDQQVIDLFAAAGVQLHCLALNQNGSPHHPRGLALTVQPQPLLASAAGKGSSGAS